jgi:hypothetical protein
MKRRTLDLLFSMGGVVLALLLVILALVMSDRADFSKDYVSRELSAQDIQFSTRDKMDPREVAFSRERTGCYLDYAGQFVTTGKQAECYANEVIGGHMTWLATRLGMTQIADLDGKSFRELGLEQTDVKAKIATAQQNGDTATVTQLNKRLTDVNTLRDKTFQGDMLRGSLLTTYGFSELGRTADQVETVAWWVAAVLLLLALAGFVHALLTPRNKAFAVPELNGKTRQTKEMTSV